MELDALYVPLPLERSRHRPAILIEPQAGLEMVITEKNPRFLEARDSQISFSVTPGGRLLEGPTMADRTLDWRDRLPSVLDVEADCVHRAVSISKRIGD